MDHIDVRLGFDCSCPTCLTNREFVDFFQIVALSEPLEKQLIKSQPSKEQVAEAIKGKVLGWGLWVGSCERKWT